MAGRTPPAAVTNFLKPLQRAVSCVTDSVLDVQGGYHPQDKPRVLLLNRGRDVRLGDAALTLRVTQQYQILRDESDGGPWRVKTLEYIYEVSSLEGGLLLGFHWHPSSEQVRFPHIHLGPAALVGREELQSAHIPSGRVSLEACVRMLIEQFGVRPGRRDWADVLAVTEEAFERWKTW